MQDCVILKSPHIPPPPHHPIMDFLSKTDNNMLKLNIIICIIYNNQVPKTPTKNKVCVSFGFSWRIILAMWPMWYFSSFFSSPPTYLQCDGSELNCSSFLLFSTLKYTNCDMKTTEDPLIILPLLPHYLPGVCFHKGLHCFLYLPCSWVSFKPLMSLVIGCLISETTG